MKFVIDSDSFDWIVTVYGFAADYAENHNIDSKLAKAEVDKEKMHLCLVFEKETHILSLGEIAQEIGHKVAIFAKRKGDDTWFIAGIGKLGS